MAKTLEQRIDDARDLRDAIENLLAGRSLESYSSLTVGDRSISKMSLVELNQALTSVEQRIKRLEKRQRRKSGKSTMVRARF